ncbi:acyl carrier protein [Campylobacter sp. RM12647]|uniref:acyl carrier protein n=1 Tax=Campylobacter sp. RM12647 TaxID=2735737 RepID=UPI001DAE5C93|nr:acyl carrier protein [Campylobacter sp. RM12647]
MKKQIIKILTEDMELNINGNENNLIQNKILDSLAIMNLIGNLEEKFNIEIDFGDITEENLNSIDDIEKLITRLKS